MADVETTPQSTSRESVDTDPLLVRRATVTIAEAFAGLLALLIVWFAGRIFLIAFGGLLVAVFLYALAHWISEWTPISYPWALALVVLLILALVATVGWSVGSRLVNQANEFAEAIPSSLKQIRDYLSKYQFGQWILDQSPDWGKAIAQGAIPSRISDVASSIVDLAVAVVIMLFVGLYVATEPRLYVEGLVRLVPVHRRPRAREVLSALSYNLQWWLIGQFIAMVCVGAITFIGLSIVGAPLALTLALLAALLEIIPNIGPVLWVVPASLVALTQGTSTVLHVVAIYAVTHMIESYILIPLVQRRSVLLPPALSILSVVLLGVLAGVLGLIVAAPIALIGMLLVKMLYVEDRLGDRDLNVLGEAHRG